jgi:two-component system sensor histidine kinase ChiS
MNGRARASFCFAALLFASIGGVSAVPAIADAPIVYRMGDGALPLVGPWERFEGLLPEADLASIASKTVELPARAMSPGGGAPGPATYRARVRIEGGASSRLALYLPAFSGVTKVYVNGRLAYDKGRDPIAPPVFLFDAPDGEVSILLQIGAGEPGLEEASVFPAFVALGDAQSVDRARMGHAFSTVILDGSFVLAGIFVLILYAFWKKNREFLAFAVFLLLAGLSKGFEGAWLFAGPAFELGKRSLELFYFVSIDILSISACFFLRAVFADRVPRSLAIPCYLVFAALGALELAFPGYLGIMGLAEQAICVLFGLGAAILMAVFSARGEAKARWLLPAFLASPAAIVLRALGVGTPWNASLFDGFALAIFSCLALLLLVKKVANSFESAEALSGYIDSVSKTVKNFIPTEFLENLDKSDLVDLRLGDHAKKEMTIFFSDIRAFTELSETLTVEENFAFINSYLSRVVPIIKENGGFVDKYIGDAIMALFAGPRGADEAIRAAIAMQGKIVEYNGHRAKMGYRPISMGVGVHTGDLMLGVVGVSDRMENTVISDAVNLASRLQAITKAFNISLAISEQSFKELEDPGEYKYRFIGKVKVKGKAAPVSVFEIFDGLAPDLFERKMKANMFFEQGMLSYYQKDFAGAMYYFRQSLEIIPEDGASSFYLDHCMNRAER